MKMNLRDGRTFSVVVFVCVAFAAGVIAFAYLSLENGIPFVEADRTITTGNGYGFSIGESREECLDVLKSKYSNRGNVVSVSSASEHAIHELKDMPETLAAAERWDIRLPAAWVNSIHLTFVADRLVEIQRNKWIMERP